MCHALTHLSFPDIPWNFDKDLLTLQDDHVAQYQAPCGVNDS